MTAIYELRGRMTDLAELGLNLYSGCTIGCRYCPDAWLRRMTWANGPTTRSRKRIFCFDSSAKQKKWRAIRARSLFPPRATPINRTRRPD